MKNITKKIVMTGITGCMVMVLGLAGMSEAKKHRVVEQLRLKLT